MMRQQLSLKLEYFILMLCHEKFKKRFNLLNCLFFLATSTKTFALKKTIQSVGR